MSKPGAEPDRRQVACLPAKRVPSHPGSGRHPIQRRRARVGEFGVMGRRNGFGARDRETKPALLKGGPEGATEGPSSIYASASVRTRPSDSPGREAQGQQHGVQERKRIRRRLLERRGERFPRWLRIPEPEEICQGRARGASAAATLRLTEHPTGERLLGAPAPMPQPDLRADSCGTVRRGTWVGRTPRSSLFLGMRRRRLHPYGYDSSRHGAPRSWGGGSPWIFRRPEAVAYH